MYETNKLNNGLDQKIRYFSISYKLKIFKKLCFYLKTYIEINNKLVFINYRINFYIGVNMYKQINFYCEK